MQTNFENDHIQGGSGPANQQRHRNSIGSSKELERTSGNVGCEREVGRPAHRGVSFSQPIMENENAQNITQVQMVCTTDNFKLSNLNPVKVAKGLEKICPEKVASDWQMVDY